jgi:hypothetical protein
VRVDRDRQQHARNFDAGHIPSGTAYHRVLTDLRKLAAKRASAGDSQHHADARHAPRDGRLLRYADGRPAGADDSTG